MNRGISFSFLSPNDVYELSQITNTSFASNFNYTGFYFIHAQLNTDSLVTIYCGQSLSSIKDRLIDHWKKFNGNHVDWTNWYNDNKEKKIIKNYYFSCFETPYGAAYENFLIYYRAVGIKFNLNTSLNGHSTLLKISEINYNITPMYALFVNNLMQGSIIDDKINNIALDIKNILF